jgi:hypothetical protein
MELRAPHCVRSYHRGDTIDKVLRAMMALEHPQCFLPLSFGGNVLAYHDVAV